MVKFTYNISVVSAQDGRHLTHFLYPCRFLLVATDMSNPLGITRYSDWDEFELIRLRPHRKWSSGKGEYDEFYGMFTVEGSIVFQVKEEGSPNRWIFPWHVSGDGKVAILGIGRSVPFEEGDGNVKACVRRVIMWKEGGRAKSISITDAAREYPVLKTHAYFGPYTRARKECD